MTARLVIDNTHRPIIVPEAWYAEHLQLGRWPVSGPARHVEIRPAIPILQILVMCAVAVFIGFCVAGAF